MLLLWSSLKLTQGASTLEQANSEGDPHTATWTIITLQCPPQGPWSHGKRLYDTSWSYLCLYEGPTRQKACSVAWLPVWRSAWQSTTSYLDGTPCASVHSLENVWWNGWCQACSQQNNQYHLVQASSAVGHQFDSWKTHGRVHTVLSKILKSTA